MSLQTQDTQTASEIGLAKILVIGVGGAGRAAVNKMIASGWNGPDFIVVETDEKSLAASKAKYNVLLQAQPSKLQNDQRISDQSADTLQDLEERIRQSNTVFIVAGLGHCTGTHFAPHIAKIAHDIGLHSYCVVTEPFQFEGSYISRHAEQAIRKLQSFAEGVIVLPNQNLFRISTEKTTYIEALEISDDSLSLCVQALAGMLAQSNKFNANPGALKKMLRNKGSLFVGFGHGTGERCGLDAIEAALTSPLSANLPTRDAKSILINITGNRSVSLFDIDEAVNRLRAEVSEDAAIIYGFTPVEMADDELRVSIIATDKAYIEIEVD